MMGHIKEELASSFRASKLISVTVTPKVMEGVERIVQETGLSRASIGRIAIERLIKEYEADERGTLRRGWRQA